MIKKIKDFDKDELYNWLKTEAGVNNGSHFGAHEGGLELQQIPEEYVEYLWFLKQNKFKTYMNIGIGNCGSFMTESYIQPELVKCVAVDNTSYGRYTNKEKIQERFDWLKNNTNLTVEFFNMNSSEFFKNNAEKFDIIFIDGDHSYNGVKLDYDNSINLLNNDGYLIFHDVNSTLCPGVVQLWKEIKNSKSIEFFYGNKCGIGVWKK